MEISGSSPFSGITITNESPKRAKRDSNSLVEKDRLSNLRKDLLKRIFTFSTLGETSLLCTVCKKFREFGDPLTVFLSQFPGNNAKETPDHLKPKVIDLPWGSFKHGIPVQYKFISSCDLVKGASIGYTVNDQEKIDALSLTEINFNQNEEDSQKLVRALPFPEDFSIEIQKGFEHTSISSNMAIAWNAQAVFVWNIIDLKNPKIEFYYLCKPGERIESALLSVSLKASELIVNFGNQLQIFAKSESDWKAVYSHQPKSLNDENERVVLVLLSVEIQIAEETRRVIVIRTTNYLQILHPESKSITEISQVSTIETFEFNEITKWLTLYHDGNKKISIFNIVTAETILKEVVVVIPSEEFLSVAALTIDTNTRTIFGIINTEEDGKEAEESTVAESTLYSWKIAEVESPTSVSSSSSIAKNSHEAERKLNYALAPKKKLRSLNEERFDAEAFQVFQYCDPRILVIWNVLQLELTFWSTDDSKKIASVRMLSYLSGYEDVALDPNDYFICEQTLFFDKVKKTLSLCFMQKSDETVEAVHAAQWDFNPKGTNVNKVASK